YLSKFDAYLKDATNNPLTPDELAGYNLFRGKGNCNSCHLDGRSTAPAPTAPASEDTGLAASTNPLFTCFGSSNLGLPLNPTEAPRPYFQKEFFQNGYIKGLKQLVDFYNARDKNGYSYPVTSGHCPPGTTEKVDCWPLPEVKNNEDLTVGDLHLTDTEENQIVAFLETLTDGYPSSYPNLDVYTGKCSGGGTS